MSPRMKNIFSFLILSGLSLFLFSCSSGQKIKNLNRPLVELQKLASDMLPFEKGKVSSNGREFYSRPFKVGKDGYYEAATTKGKIAIIKVLGDGRPYTVSVEVINQTRTETGEYLNAGTDEALTRVLRRRVEKALHERRGDRNVIDDFRAY